MFHKISAEQIKMYTAINIAKKNLQIAKKGNSATYFVVKHVEFLLLWRAF